MFGRWGCEGASDVDRVATRTQMSERGCHPGNAAGNSWFPRRQKNFALVRGLPQRARRPARAMVHLALSPSRKAIASSSTLTASMTGTTGRAWNSKAGNIEQNL